MEILLSFAMLGGIVWFWADGARAREQMLKRCRGQCEQLGVQLLDQTVGLARLALGRGGQGRVQLRRWYTFEYSISGADRWRGTAVLSGHRVEHIRMEHPDGPIIVEGGTRLRA